MAEMDAKTIIAVLDTLLGESSEPVGDSLLDRRKLDVQLKEERIIDWLMDDMYRCYNCKDVYWASGRVAGTRAEKFLRELYDSIGEVLKENKQEP